MWNYITTCTPVRHAIHHVAHHLHVAHHIGRHLAAHKAILASGIVLLPMTISVACKVVPVWINPPAAVVKHVPQGEGWRDGHYTPPAGATTVAPPAYAFDTEHDWHGDGGLTWTPGSRDTPRSRPVVVMSVDEP